MIYRTTPFVESEDVAGVLGDATKDALLPKIIYTDSSYVILNTSAEQTGYTPTASETRVLYPEEDLGLEFGSDYSVAVFLSRGANYVFNQSLPAPVLTLTVNVDNNPSLEWTSSYLEPTKVYRTEVYTTGGTQPSEYTLIAEVDGYTTSNGTSTYVDTGVTLGPGESVDYFITNANGESSIEVASVANPAN